MDKKNQIDLVSIITEVKVYYKSVVENLKWIMGIALFVTILFVIFEIRKEPSYKAEFTFMVNDDEGGGMSGMRAILGQFGMVGGDNNYQKIIEIAKSDRVISELIIDSVFIEGKHDIIGNHIIDIYDLQSDWEDDSVLNNFRFGHNVKVSSLNQNRAIKFLIQKLIGSRANPSSNVIMEIGFNEESSILKVSSSTPSPELSVALCKGQYDILSKYYIEKTTEPQMTTYEYLDSKADSVHSLLYGTESSLASFLDRSRGVLLMKDKLPKMRNQRQMSMYGEMYAEILKNRETSEFMLKIQTPYFQVIDEPFLPLENNNRLNIITIIAIFLGSVILVILFALSITYYRSEIKPLLIG